jgi:hypothetical protein
MCMSILGCAQYATRPATDSLAPAEWGTTIHDRPIAAPVRDAPSVTIEDRLRTLGDLQQKGLITPEEAKVRRAEILKEL